MGLAKINLDINGGFFEDFSLGFSWLAFSLKPGFISLDFMHVAISTTFSLLHHNLKR